MNVTLSNKDEKKLFVAQVFDILQVYQKIEIGGHKILPEDYGLQYTKDSK